MFFISNLLSSKRKRDILPAFVKMGIIEKVIIPWYDVFFSHEEDEDEDVILTGQIQLLRMIVNFSDKDNHNNIYKGIFLTNEEHLCME